MRHTQFVLRQLLDLLKKASYFPLIGSPLTVTHDCAAIKRICPFKTALARPIPLADAAYNEVAILGKFPQKGSMCACHELK